MIQFALDDTQEQKIRDWQKNHVCPFRMPDGQRKGGSLGDIETYSFVPTTVGVIAVVKCA